MLYPLTNKDISAIARVRAFKHVPQGLKYILYVGLAVAIIGVLVMFIKSLLIGFIVAVVGLAIYLFYDFKVGKIRNKLANEYKQELRESVDSEK